MASTVTPNALLSLSAELADAVERAARSVVAIDARPRIAASGVLWDSTTVIGAEHTIRRETGITVTLPDGRTVGATLVGRDPGTDLAALRLEEPADPPIATTDDPVRPGQLVLAVGRTGPDGPSASLGIVSAVGEGWRTWRGGRIDRFVRLDLAIYYGFSGSPLVDPAGRMLGLNTSALTRGSPVTIPISTIRRVVPQLVGHGGVRRGYLGVSVQAIPLRATGATGLIVLGLEPGGPAERAGLLVGDVITALDGAGLADAEQLRDRLTGERAASPLRLSVMRAGSPVEVTVTPAERRRGR
ncbi:MAG TPA: S1C family serine protease [Gemmatimonadales bacterium]|nr:S1C family serine protease [Gemmatimonadales bacterium]